MSGLERDIRFGNDRAEGAGAVTVRTTGKAVVARAVDGTLFVLDVEHTDGRQRVGRGMDHAAELQREHGERSANDPGDDGGTSHEVFSGYANPSSPQASSPGKPASNHFIISAVRASGSYEFGTVAGRAMSARAPFMTSCT